MTSDNHKFDELSKVAHSYASISELAEKLQSGYHEITRRFDEQSKQLEDINSQLSEALEENSKLTVYLNNILECLNAGVIVLGVDGRINLFNRAAEKITGVSRKNALGMNYSDVFPGEEHYPTSQLLEKSEKKVHGEKWYNSIPVGYSSSRMFGENGDFNGVVEILHDISAEKKLRETIRHVSALAALGEMTATVAHQVRNPLASIIGFTDLLIRDLPRDHSSAEISQKISQGANELNRIITNLMDFTKKTEPKFRELDMAEFICKTISLIEKEPFTAKIKIELNIDFQKLTYKFDPILLRQVFINIAQNACQAMKPDKGTLKITVEIIEKQNIIIKFIDTGKGIPDDELESIFKPFYTSRAKGTGLGLSMVKKVVDFHNGTIAAENNKNGGAVFVIKLPL